MYRWTLGLGALALGCADPDGDKAADEDPAGTDTEVGAEADTDTDGSPEGDTDVTTETDTDPKSEPLEGPWVEIASVTDAIEVGASKVVEASAGDPLYPHYQLTTQWSSTLEGPLATPTPDIDGKVYLDTSTLSPGTHGITLGVQNPDGLEASDTEWIDVCFYEDPVTFDTDITGPSWMLFGDAYWDPGGWLEMTGNITWREGQVAYLEKQLPAGDLSIAFDILTGGGTGADGFAVSIINVPSVQDLVPIIQAANDGGCLGYGVNGGGSCESGIEVDAFHIEFDTWYNAESFIADPTSENHVAITLDGHPGIHYLWAAIPTIEDSQWHEVLVETEGDSVVVTMDGVDVIKGDIPDLNFEGGWVTFSGTTGSVTNYHRFDNMQIRDECFVP